MATITGIATGNADFSILVSALTYLDAELDTDLVATLDAPDADLTVFAPTNAAFAALAADLGYDGDSDDFDAVTTFLVSNVPAATLLDVVTYHVSPGTQLSGDVAGSMTLDTLNGATIGVDLPTLVDNEPDLLDPSIIALDQVADNGVIHVIDRVLLPVDLPGNDAMTITEIVAASGSGFDSNGSDFDMLLAAVSAAGLADTLDSDMLDATVFAPNDEAFIAAAQTLGYDGSDEEGAFGYIVEALALLNGEDAIGLLQQVLTYHVSGESLQASQVLAATDIATLQGGTIGVDGTTLVDADPDLPDPGIVATDILASNGIIHVIDGVLLPVDVLNSDGSNDVDFVIDSDRSNTFSLGLDDDYIDGNGGADVISAGDGNDVVYGGRGKDDLSGDDGKDNISGGSGDDTISGGDRGDILRGNHGNDEVSGGKGADRLWGHGGEDVLNGDKGTDWLNGGNGNDTLTGGLGNDEFVFKAGTGQDVITDFTSGDDVLNLTSLGIDELSDLAGAITDTMDGALIDLGGGDSVLLQGVMSASLTDSDFL